MSVSLGKGLEWVNMFLRGAENAVLWSDLLENVHDLRNVATHFGVEAHIDCVGLGWRLYDWQTIYQSYPVIRRQGPDGDFQGELICGEFF